MPPIPLIVLLGPTASGKSALAVALAERLVNAAGEPAEIISADAMAVYRGMDLGTAKPTPADRARIRHHLIDVVEPSDRCDGQRWFELADAAARDLHQRGRTVIVAGGTPLYVKLLLEGISAGAPRDPAVRARLQERYRVEGGAVLHAELQRIDPDYARDRHPNDERRIVRALEVHALTGRPYSSFHVTDGRRRASLRPLLIGLDWPVELLNQRINARTEAMFASGLVEEVRGLRERLSAEASQAVGYKEVIDHLDGKMDLPATIDQVRCASRRLGKHQRTWYRGWPDIRWIPGDAADLLDQVAAAAQAWIEDSDRPGPLG